MTVAVAVIKGGRTVLAADSLVTFGGERFPVSNGQFHKIRRIGESLVAWAGWTLYGELLDAHLSASAAPPSTLASESEVFDFFIAFWRVIRKDFNWVHGGNHQFASLDSTFLLANRHGIFRIAGDMDVAQFHEYTAVGSGSKYALGAMRILFDLHEDPTLVARSAVQVGIDFDVHCGGEIDVAEVPPPAPSSTDDGVEVLR